MQSLPRHRARAPCANSSPASLVGTFWVSDWHFSARVQGSPSPLAWITGRRWWTLGPGGRKKTKIWHCQRRTLLFYFIHSLLCCEVVQFSSLAQLCPTLCNPMNRSTPGLPVHHQLPEFTQTHVHWVGDALQPSHLLSSPSPPAFNLSQHQGLFKWVSSLHQVAEVLGVSASTSVLPMNTQD